MRPSSVALCSKQSSSNLRSSVFPGRQDVNRPRAQSHRHGARQVHIHVEGDAQRVPFRSFRFRRKPGSENSAASLSDSSSPCRDLSVEVTLVLVVVGQGAVVLS